MTMNHQYQAHISAFPVQNFHLLLTSLFTLILCLLNRQFHFFEFWHCSTDASQNVILTMMMWKKVQKEVGSMHEDHLQADFSSWNKSKGTWINISHPIHDPGRCARQRTTVHPLMNISSWPYSNSRGWQKLLESQPLDTNQSLQLIWVASIIPSLPQICIPPFPTLSQPSSKWKRDSHFHTTLAHWHQLNLSPSLLKFVDRVEGAWGCCCLIGGQGGCVGGQLGSVGLQDSISWSNTGFVEWSAGPWFSAHYPISWMECVFFWYIFTWSRADYHLLCPQFPPKTNLGSLHDSWTRLKG